MSNKPFPAFNSNQSDKPEAVSGKLPLPPRGGKISGFPAPKKSASQPAKLPAPPTFPPKPTLAAPVAPLKQPSAFPAPVNATLPSSVNLPPEEVEAVISDVMTISEEELKDVVDYRGAQRAKFITEEKAYILATSVDPVVRKELATNPDTPVGVLKMLAKDEDEQVREEIVFNPSTPADVYESLADDPSTFVAEGLILNPRTQSALLKRVNHRNDPYLLKLLAARGF